MPASHRGGPGSSPGQVMWDCGTQSCTGARFLRVLRFPLHFSFHRLLHTHHLSSGADSIGQLVAGVPSGLSLTAPQKLPRLGQDGFLPDTFQFISHPTVLRRMF
jgi:hypothetical protein